MESSGHGKEIVKRVFTGRRGKKGTKADSV